jgi:hypothetical protein
MSHCIKIRKLLSCSLLAQNRVFPNEIHSFQKGVKYDNSGKICTMLTFFQMLKFYGVKPAGITNY